MQMLLKVFVCLQRAKNSNFFNDFSGSRTFFGMAESENPNRRKNGDFSFAARKRRSCYAFAQLFFRFVFAAKDGDRFIFNVASVEKITKNAALAQVRSFGNYSDFRVYVRKNGVKTG